MRQQLEVAVRHSLAAQARNRLAWVPLVAFVPGWYLLIGSMDPWHRGAAFILRSNGTRLVVDGHDLTLITAGLSAITLITGFVVFAATRRAIPFDRRLILSGYRPAALITAKTTAALAVAAAVGGYAAVVILAFWRPAALWSIAVAFVLAAASYAALGLLAGVLVRGDLEGFFLIIMTAMLDTFLENPVDNPLANKPVLEFFPSYGPTQFAAAGVFHHQALAGMIAVSLGWTAAFALLGLVVLRAGGCRTGPRGCTAPGPCRRWRRASGGAPSAMAAAARHSARRTAAGLIRAADRPGTALTTTARNHVAGMTSSTSSTGMTMTSDTPRELANSAQDQRPASSPSGSGEQGRRGQRQGLPRDDEQKLRAEQADSAEDSQVPAPAVDTGHQHVGQRPDREQDQQHAESQRSVRTAV